MESIKDRVKRMAHEQMLKEAKVNEENVLEHSKRSVTQANKLSRAAQRLTLNEKRIVYMMISQINPVRSDNPNTFRVKGLEMSNLFNIPLSNVYRDMKNASKKLYDRSWEVLYNGEVEETNRWIYRTKYHRTEGWVEMSFTPETMAHLQSIRKHFTKYRLSEVVDFKTTYAWKLFEILASVRKSEKDFSGWLKVSTKDLRDQLEVPKSYSSGMFKKRILNVAINELETKRSLVIKLDEIKTGKKITQYNFIFTEDEQQSLDL